MKIELYKKDLIDVLNVCQHVIGPKRSDDAWNLTKLTFVDQKMILQSTDGDSDFQYSFNSATGNGSICLNYHDFKRMVNTFKTKTICLEVKDNSIGINNIFTQKILSSSDLYPGSDILPMDFKWSILPDDLKKSIDRCLYAIGENETRKNLMGLNISSDGDVLRFMGADGFRIAEQKFNRSCLDFDLIVPKSAYQALSKLCSKADLFQVGFDDYHISFTSPGLKFRSRLIEADYPNLDTLLNHRQSCQVEFNRKLLLETLIQIKEISESESNDFIKFDFGDNSVLLATWDKTKTDLVVNYDDKPCYFALNLSLLIETLNNMKVETIFIRFDNFKDSPIVIENDDWNDFRSLLMPVRIEW